MGGGAAITAGRSRDNSGAPRDVGHLYGFGNTLEYYLVMVKGCKQRGGPASGPYDHTTGKGCVHATDGHYKDGLYNKGSTVILNLVEALGRRPLPTRGVATLAGGTACAGQGRSRRHIIRPPAHQHKELRRTPCAAHLSCSGVQRRAQHLRANWGPQAKGTPARPACTRPCLLISPEG